MRRSTPLVFALSSLALACSSSSSGGQKDAGGDDGAADSGIFADDIQDADAPADGSDGADGTDATTDVVEADVPEVEPDVPEPEPDIPEAEPDVPEPEPDIPVVDDDKDDDGIPDLWDPALNNAGEPGVVVPGKVYAHTATTLVTMDVKTYKLTEVGDFTFDKTVDNSDVTDIAIDRYGVLTAVSYDDLWRCNPTTAACKHLGTLDAPFNALSWVPAGTIDPNVDVLVAAADGGWFRLDPAGAVYISTQLGEYGGGYTSSGDIYSLNGGGTYASVNGVGANAGIDVLVEVNPLTGQVVQEVGPLTGYKSVFGIAGWTSRAFAFDSSGTVLVVDVTDGSIIKEIKDTGYKWWGAGVPTVVPEE